MVVLDARRARRPRARARAWSRGSRGAGRARRPRARRRTAARSARRPPGRSASVSAVLRSPMWWRDPGAPPARQAERALELGPAGEHVALGRRPAARAGWGRRRASGAAAAAARRPRAAPSRRCACGSGGRGAGTGRRCGRAARARRRPRRRSARRTRCRWSSPAARRRRASSRWCSGAVREHHAELGRARRHRPRHERVAAARREHDRPVAPGAAAPPPPVPAPPAPARASTSRRHQRERLLLAVLARAQPRDRLLVGGQARQVDSRRCPSPPRSRRPVSEPATLGVRPLPVLRLSKSVPATEGSDPQRGPQAGQALGWAWKRRSDGSSYSAAQAAHIVKPAIVVSGRS